MYMYFNANVGDIPNLSLYFTPTRQNKSYSKGILYDETFSLSIITGVWKRSFPCLHLAPRVGIKYFLSLKHICKTSKWAPKHNYIGSCLCDNRSSGNALSYRKASYLAPNKRKILKSFGYRKTSIYDLYMKTQGMVKVVRYIKALFDGSIKNHFFKKCSYKNDMILSSNCFMVFSVYYNRNQKHRFSCEEDIL